MTLPEVVAHVASVKNFAEKHEAEKEVLKALKGNAFYWRRFCLIRWEYKFSGKLPKKIRPPDVPLIRWDRPPDVPPRGQGWGRAEIRWDTGEVLDPHGAVKYGKWRPAWRRVLLARSQVMRIWPEPRQVFDGSASPGAPTSVNVVPPARRRTGPQPKKKLSMKNAMKTDILEKQLTREQLHSMHDHELVLKYGDKVGAKRTACREARDEVLAELDGTNSVK
jgi:hypothetical protein